jgi:hypothetical protein
VTGNSRYCCKAIKWQAISSEGPRTSSSFVPGFCTRSLCLRCHYAACRKDQDFSWPDSRGKTKNNKELIQ